MTNGPEIKGNPLKIFVFLLVLSYFLGEFIFPKYHLLYFFHMIGIIGFIISIGIFKSFITSSKLNLPAADKDN